HVVDINIMIEEFGIARDFGRKAGGAIVDQRGEVAISPPVEAIDPAKAQADAAQSIFGGESLEQLFTGDLARSVDGSRPQRRVLGDDGLADVAIDADRGAEHEAAQAVTACKVQKPPGSA